MNNLNSLVLKRFFILLLFLIFIYCSKKDNTDNSSKTVSDSVNYYLEQSNNYDLSDSIRLKFAKRAYKLIKIQKSDSLNFINRFYVAFRFYNLNKLNDYKQVLSSTLESAIKENDTINIARAYAYLGDYYYDVNLSDSAYYNYYQAEKLFFKLKNNKLVGLMYLKKANTQIKVMDYYGSEKSAVTALNYFRIEKNKNYEYDAYNILGMSCLEIKDFEKSLDYFNKTLDLAIEGKVVDYYQTKALALSNIGNVYQKKEDYKSALNYFQRAIKEPNLYNEYSNLYASILNELTYSKFKLGKSENVPDDFYKALKIFKANESLTNLFGCKIHLSEYYESIKELDSARKYADLAYKLSKDSRIINLQLKALNQLTKINPENTNTYSKEYLSLNDSVIKMERNVAEKFARIEFETDEFKRQKERLSAQNQNIIVFSLLGFLLIILLYVVKDQRSRNVQFKLKEAQQRANEEIFALMLSQQKMMDESVQKEKQRIGQELHDGVLGRLFGARLNLDSANRRDDEKGIEIRNHYINELKYIEQDIREISHELNRERFALINNFVAIITNLFEEQKLLKDTVYFSYTIDSVINWDNVPNNIKINVYRIIQEALQNINKYAEAKNVSVAIVKDAENIHISIIDDGVGFDVSRKSKGIGLLNIESRVKTCKGKLEIKSKKGKGTSISIDLPIHGS